MITPLDPGRYRRAAWAAMTLVLFGIMSAIPLGAAAQSSGASPTVGNITVDTYDCISGVLDFHVPVTNLPHMSSSQGNGYLGYEVHGQYEQGPLDTSIPAHQFNVQPQLSPFSGNVFLEAVIPPAIDDTGGIGPSGDITAIKIRVVVIDDSGGAAYSASTFTIDCSVAQAQHAQLVQQLIAQLVLILDDILNG